MPNAIYPLYQMDWYIFSLRVVGLYFSFCWVFAVCICPTKRTLGLYGLIFSPCPHSLNYCLLLSISLLWYIYCLLLLPLWGIVLCPIVGHCIVSLVCDVIFVTLFSFILMRKRALFALIVLWLSKFCVFFTRGVVSWSAVCD